MFKQKILKVLIHQHNISSIKKYCIYYLFEQVVLTSNTSHFQPINADQANRIMDELLTHAEHHADKGSNELI